jgi:hypothetical protein
VETQAARGAHLLVEATVVAVLTAWNLEESNFATHLFVCPYSNTTFRLSLVLLRRVLPLMYANIGLEKELDRQEYNNFRRENRKNKCN